MSSMRDDHEPAVADRRTVLTALGAIAGGAALMAGTAPARAAGAEANIAIVRSIYDAFFRGDVPAILAALHPDVAWEPGYAHNGDIPWLRSGSGHEHVVAFFTTLQGFGVNRFEVLEVMGAGSHVAAIVNLDFTWKATGRQIVEPSEVHLWRFGDDGLVRSLRHASDTRQHARALQPMEAFGQG